MFWKLHFTVLDNFKIKISSNALTKLRSENVWKLWTAIINRPMRLQLIIFKKEPLSSLSSIKLEVIRKNRGGVEDTRLDAKAKDTKKIRGQGQEQPFRGQTLSRPRTGVLEAKAKDQGHKRKCSPKKKKKGLHVFTKIFQAISTKKRFPKNFQALHKIFTRTGQFSRTWGLEAKAKDLTSEAKAKDFKMCPRGLHLCARSVTRANWFVPVRWMNAARY